MSLEHAQAFMEKVKNDEDLAKRLNEAEGSESRLNIAKDLGYEFTLEEARQAGHQLSEEALERAAGGSSYSWEACTSAGDYYIMRKRKD